MKYSLILAVILLSSFGNAPKEEQYDLVVYGGTSSGVIAAYAAAKEGLNVALLEPSAHLGGLTAGGLGHVDVGNPQTIGGYSKEFLTRVGNNYGLNRLHHKVESSVAERIFLEMLGQTNVKIFYNIALARKKGGVVKKGKKIEKIVTENGRVFGARYYIDATYVGDLMAASGVSYAVGRESVDEYGEPSAGIQSYKLVRRLNGTQLDEIKQLHTAFPLDNVFSNRETVGGADKRVQAYTYRLCVTDNRENQKAFDKPANYNPLRYRHMLARITRLRLFTLNKVFTLSDLYNGKFDLNHMDLLNASWGYPEASYADRKYIENYHKEYQQGLLYFLANDQSVPEALRNDTKRYGYALDEFADNDNWPYHLYVREARRMKGEYIMRQSDVWDSHTKDDAIGIGSYFTDSHTVERFITDEMEQYEEGEMKHTPFRPYEIPYRAILPKATQCENLLVTVCMSATHTVYGSLRMEPVYMITGHAAAVAIAEAAKSSSTVQKVDIKCLQKKLLSQGQILNFVPGSEFYIKKESVSGYVMDDTDAVMSGHWSHSSAVGPFLMYDYCFANQTPNGSAYIEYSPKLANGVYEVQLMYSPGSNRSKAVFIVIQDADGQKELSVDMTRKPESSDYWFSIGTCRFTNNTHKVTITNRGEGGVVVADGVRFIKKI